MVGTGEQKVEDYGKAGGSYTSRTLLLSSGAFPSRTTFLLPVPPNAWSGEDGLEKGRSRTHTYSEGEQGDAACDRLDGIAVHLGTFESGGTLGSTGSNGQLLDEVRIEQTHQDGKEPEEGKGQA